MNRDNDSLLPGDLVQITDENHRWYPTVIVVDEIKTFGIQGFAFMPTNDGSGTGQAYIRLRTGEFESLGVSLKIMPASMAMDREKAEEEIE